MLSIVKTAERGRAEILRREQGMSVREIAAAVGVSGSTASLWLRDVELTAEQRAALVARNPVYNGQAKGAATNAARARTRHEAYQTEGRRRIRSEDSLYVAGCMLHWAEGDKRRGSVRFTNSDPAMVALFVRFLRQCFRVPDDALRVRCHLYVDHSSEQSAIEDYWLNLLDLPRQALNRSTVNVYSRASKRKRLRTLPYGTCCVAVHNTSIAQTIYGSIQELGGFEPVGSLG
jgi:transcriptional regulator with XRE-family HTH domain